MVLHQTHPRCLSDPCCWSLRPWILYQVMVGLVLRDHLMVLLRRCLAAGGAAAVAAHPVPYEELSRHVVTAAARSYVSEQQMAVLQVRSPGP